MSDRESKAATLVPEPESAGPERNDERERHDEREVRRPGPTELVVAPASAALLAQEPEDAPGTADPREPRIAAHVRAILDELGLDPGDPNLRETDRRVARMYLEMFHGLEEGAEPTVTTFPNDEGYSHMVMEKDIPFYSLCAHHLVPFYGKAHIAYIPRERILGLSKFARILEFYAKRPQLQERLTEQVVNYLQEKLEPLGAMVVVEARHLCVEMRGVKKPGALTTTSAIRGVFHQRPVREEFLDLLRHRS